MLNRVFIFSLITATTVSCSSAMLPFSDRYEIKKGKSILVAYTCEDLIEKAEDKDFSLKNLAALRAMARCPDYKFDFAKLSEFESKLYAREVESFNSQSNKEEPTPAPEPDQLSTEQLKSKIKKEKDPSEKYSLYKNLRNRLKKNVDRKEYFEVTTQMLNWALKNHKKSSKKLKADAAEILYSAAQLHARTFWTADDGQTAMKSIDDSIVALGTSTSLGELYYLKARIADEAKDYTSAVTFYDLTIEDMKKFSNKTSYNLDRVMWLKAWILYKERSFAAAAEAFAELAAFTSDLSEKSRAQFFQARSLKALDKTDEAKTLLEGIAAQDFFGYYGLVAHKELNKKLPALSSIKPTDNLKIDLKLESIPEPQRSVFIDLIKYREFNLAEKAIGMISSDKNEDVSLSVYFAKKAQLYLPVFRAFTRLDNNDKTELFLKFPEVIFPTPYEDQVENMSEKTNIPPSLIYSIMKQESAFNERARSHADAMGLMQVIPRLAKELSRKFEIPYKIADDLYDPEINIQLGTYELMEQVRRQNGQLTYVAAAYNAGPNALAGWLKNRNRDDILEFIEEIPYDETRTYVKLIARNKIFYERISKRYSEHEFPAGFLNN